MPGTALRCAGVQQRSPQQSRIVQSSQVHTSKEYRERYAARPLSKPVTTQAPRRHPLYDALHAALWKLLHLVPPTHGRPVTASRALHGRTLGRCPTRRRTRRDPPSRNSPARRTGTRPHAPVPPSLHPCPLNAAAPQGTAFGGQRAPARRPHAHLPTPPTPTGSLAHKRPSPPHSSSNPAPSLRPGAGSTSIVSMRLSMRVPHGSVLRSKSGICCRYLSLDSALRTWASTQASAC